MCFAVLFCVIFALVAFASDLANPDENIAGQYKSFSKTADAWNVAPQYLVDGDRSTGTSAYHHVRYTEMSITFDRDIVFGKLVIVTNSIGTFPSTGYSTGGSKSNFAFWYGVKLLDADGKVVADLGNRVAGSNDENENGEVIYDLSNKLVAARTITITMDNQWSNSIGLWELEAYEHKCSYDTVKEAYMEATCLENGNGLYECKCGATKHDIIPALGYHTYDSENPVVEYPNGILQDGIEKHCCKTCDDYLSYTLSPPFKFLGYSINYNGTSVCAGYAIDKEAIERYEEINKVSFKYGAIISTQKAKSYVDSEANLLVSSGVKREVDSVETRRFDICLSFDDWSSIADYEFLMCAYVIEGNKVYYICNENTPLEEATYISYNSIKGEPLA